MTINLQARALAGERKRTRTRTALLEAAKRVIAVKGPHAASIGEFTIEAGVSRGTFYNYFPTLEDLILALSGDIVETLDREVQAAIAEVDDPAERLARSCLSFIAKGVDDPVWGWVFLRLDATALSQVDRARRRFEIEFNDGVAAGRFRPAGLGASYAVVGGSVRMAVRMVLNGADRACAAETVQLILIALGLDPSEAARLCRPAQDL